VENQNERPHLDPVAYAIILWTERISLGAVAVELVVHHVGDLLNFLRDFPAGLT